MWRLSVHWSDVVLAVLLAIAVTLAAHPHDCHVSVQPVFGPDLDSPIGVGVDGARVSTKCIF